MTHSAPRGLTAVLLVSLFVGFGCSTDDPPPPAGDPSALVVTTPQQSPPALDPQDANTRQCTSKITAPGLVCSQCPGHLPGADPECMAAQCFVEDKCLRCTDPRGRSARDCSKDYSVITGGSSFGESANGEFNFAACDFQYGGPSAPGTTCHYPGVNTCVVNTTATSRCEQCAYPDGSSSSLCGDPTNPLYDPLIDRPDDFPATGVCTNTLDAKGQVECSVCVHDDLSVTNSCRYPDIVSCDVGIGGPDSCAGTCTYKDGHKAKLCESPHGLHPVPI